MSGDTQGEPAATTIRRLGVADIALARATFTMMAAVFEEETDRLGEDYLTSLLAQDAFWALVAVRDGEPVGGLTAHALPMTHRAGTSLFIYDLAVRTDCQRQGIGRALVHALHEAAAARGITSSFVPADNEDTHALDFYRALGGEPAEVTIFSFDTRPPAG